MPKYFFEGTEVSYSECLECFILYSGFSKDDAISEFKDNDTADSCEYITELCSEIEVIYPWALNKNISLIAIGAINKV